MKIRFRPTREWSRRNINSSVRPHRIPRQTVKYAHCWQSDLLKLRVVSSTSIGRAWAGNAQMVVVRTHKIVHFCFNSFSLTTLGCDHSNRSVTSDWVESCNLSSAEGNLFLPCTGNAQGRWPVDNRHSIFSSGYPANREEGTCGMSRPAGGCCQRQHFSIQLVCKSGIHHIFRKTAVDPTGRNRPPSTRRAVVAASCSVWDNPPWYGGEPHFPQPYGFHIA